jgi:hypothetical protein
MSAERTGAAATAAGLFSRMRAAWRVLEPDQRLAAYAAAALFATMFLPWYQQTGSAVVRGKTPTILKVSDNLNAFQAFSFVEVAVLLVAIAILLLLFARGERRAFHLPGGDGTVILAAGVWVCFLVFYRQLDKPDASAGAGASATVGVQWGIFITFLAGLALAYAGTRVRAAHHTEPPLPGEVAESEAVTQVPPAQAVAPQPPAATPAPAPAPPRRRVPDPPPEQPPPAPTLPFDPPV